MLTIEQILELIEKENIIGVERIYFFNTVYSAISVFPNGRIYNYYNLENYELGGPFTTIEDAEKILIDTGYREVWRKQEERNIETSEVEYLYEIIFTLTADVNNMKRAQEYLDNDDFTQYIRDEISNKSSSKLKNIKYKLRSPYYGNVYVTTTGLLDDVNEQEIKLALDNFQINELNDGWMEQDFAITGKIISEFKPLSKFSQLELKEKIEC